MFTARKKIAKEKGADPDEFEESVAQVCVSTATIDCASDPQPVFLRVLSCCDGGRTQNRRNAFKVVQIVGSKCLVELTM